MLTFLTVAASNGVHVAGLVAVFGDMAFLAINFSVISYSTTGTVGGRQTRSCGKCAPLHPEDNPLQSGQL